MSWRFFALLAGCVLLGCGGDDGGTTSSGGSSGAGGASGTGGVATGGTGGVATGGTGGVATGGTGGVATGGTGGVATGGTGGVATGGTGGVATGGTGGGATGGTGGVATGGTGGATGGTSGGPSSASYRLSAPKRVLHGTVTTSAGGLVVAQSTPSASKTELLHFDSSGQLQWAQQYTSPGSFYFRLDAGARRAAGGYAFSGTSNLNTGPGVVTAITATGQLDWAKSYAAFVWFTRIHPTADGGFFASGSASAKYGVVRLDAQGNVKWGSNYTPPGTGSVFDTTVTSDDGIAFVGAVPSSGELLIAKLDSKGTQVFAKTVKMGSVAGHNGRVVAMPGGGFMAALLASSASVLQTVAVLVIDASGNVLSAQHYPGLSFATHMVANPKGGYILAGSGAGYPTSSPWWGLADATGALSSVRNLPETTSGYSSQVYGVAPKSDGSFLMTTSRTDNQNWIANIDTIDAGGSSCPPSSALNLTKTPVTATTANGGSFSSLTVVASSFTVTPQAVSSPYALVCGS